MNRKKILGHCGVLDPPLPLSNTNRAWTSWVETEDAFYTHSQKHYLIRMIGGSAFFTWNQIGWGNTEEKGREQQRGKEVVRIVVHFSWKFCFESTCVMCTIWVAMKNIVIIVSHSKSKWEIPTFLTFWYGPNYDGGCGQLTRVVRSGSQEPAVTISGFSVI